MPRHLFLAALLIPSLAHADFNGAWVGWICPSGVERSSGQCANFVLELMEKDGTLCGTHMFATAGAERIDEGGAPSLTGEVTEAAASGVAVSTLGPQPVRVRVALRVDGNTLRWERLDNPSGETLLPKQARLTRSRSRTLFAPLFEQELRAACTYVFNLAAAAREPAIPGSAGEGAPAAPEAAPAAPPSAR
ncbi:MAG TPA: hypothetical protein VM406_07640 [Noviherbaspirillum sp.]|nr:hypothetical protein [Noviherbaspirillum sp.]